ncbi:gp141 [Sphingomonas phage PAU]|uniref:DprA-like DNA recombination-mediator protein n=1 Tax=Sphingomonas phage PAU TaxID=1150991 RepID=UPI00025732D9|nr:DprA-like DNA recombination-mediator protein [Sphingomonas phage PAU]AFF28139.1 gp141 [Sphingomonas phage PAU]
MRNLIYTGIGSRETPDLVLSIMSKIAKFLETKGYTVRSGGAPGADLAFDIDITNKEIYLPWYRFNDNNSKLFKLTNEAREIAEKFHPAWNKLSEAARKLMTRNVYQVLGFDLKSPTNFIICWTKDGKASRGTGQALRIAKYYNIPVYNLFNQSDRNDLKMKLSMM